MADPRLTGTGVAILLAYDGHRVVGPGPHLRCTSDDVAAYVHAVGYASQDAAKFALKQSSQTLTDAGLIADARWINLGTMYRYPTLTVRRKAA